MQDIATGILLRECRFLRGWNGDDPNLPVQPLQQRRGLLHFEDNTFPEQNDFVCDCFEIRYNMRRQQNELLLGKITAQTEDRVCFSGLKPRRRLVQHQNFGISKQCLCDSHTLPLSAGETFQLFLLFVLQTDHMQKIVCLPLGLKF